MLESALAIVGAVLAAAILLGAVYAAFRSSDLRATVRDQQARIRSLTVDRDELARELAEERSERALLARRLSLAEERMNHLEEIVSGRIDFSALETQLEGHHHEVMRRSEERHDATLEALRDIKALLEAKRAGDR